MDRKVGLALLIVVILALSSSVIIGESVTSNAPIIVNIRANDLPTLDAKTVATWARGGIPGPNPPPSPPPPEVPGANAVIVNPFEFQFPNPTLIEYIKTTLSGKGYIVATVQNDQVTVVWLRTGLAGMKVIFWRGHGGWFDTTVVLATGEKAKVRGTVLFLPADYVDDYKSGRIVVGYIPGVGYFYCITPSFVTYYYDTSLGSSLVYVEACGSLKNTSMASAFVTSSGPGVYIGWTESVTVSYGDNTAYDCFTKFASGSTVADVIAIGYEDTYTGAKLDYYGNGSLKL